MEDKIYTVGNCLVYLGAAVQPDLLFKWIQLGLGILLTLLGIAYRIWIWYKKAKADGKITGEEVAEIIEQEGENVINIVGDITMMAEEIKDSKDQDKIELKATEEDEFREPNKKI